MSVKGVPSEEIDDLMAELIETTSYHEDRPILPWREVPDTGEDPDDDLDPDEDEDKDEA